MQAERDKGLRGKIDILSIPKQHKKNTVAKNIKSAIQVNLIETETGKIQTFKSMFAAFKFLGVNPGTVSSNKNTDKIIKSKRSDSEYRVSVANI